MDEETVKKTDMRWARTERHLMKALDEALDATPLEKITVTALSREAEINKATFYLHYRDIYDLSDTYVHIKAQRAVEEVANLDAFFGNPRLFVGELIDILSKADFRRAIGNMAKNHLVPQFMNELTVCLSDAFRTVKPVPDEGAAEIVVSFVMYGVMGALMQHGETDQSKLINVLGGLLEAIMEKGRKMDEIRLQ